MEGLEGIQVSVVDEFKNRSATVSRELQGASPQCGPSCMILIAASRIGVWGKACLDSIHLSARIFLGALFSAGESKPES